MDTPIHDQATGRYLADEASVQRVLEQAGVRATPQRIGLARLLFQGSHRHVVANELHLEAAAAGLSISMATVYNTLRQLVSAGLLRELTVDADRAYFDTNMQPHCHLYDASTAALSDLPMPHIHLPPGIDAREVEDVELLIRIRSAK